MGRTNPTFRDRIRGLEDAWSDYRRALRRRDRERFDRLFEYARAHADAGGYLNHPDPVVPVLVSVAVEQEARIDDLRERVETLEARVVDLAERTDDDRRCHRSGDLDAAQARIGECDRGGIGERHGSGTDERDGGRPDDVREANGAPDGH